MSGRAIVAIIVGFLLLLYAVDHFSEPQEIDWSANLRTNRTTPYGTYVTHDLLEEIFPDKKIATTRRSIEANAGEHLADYVSDIESIKKTQGEKMGTIRFDDPKHALTDTLAYVFICNTFESTSEEAALLSIFVNMGHNVFISAEDYSKSEILDYLGLSQSMIPVNSSRELQNTYYLTDYPDKQYDYSALNYATTIATTDSCRYKTQVLAKKDNGDAVFIKVEIGKGACYIHTLPIAFTNIEVLNKQKTDFAFKSLSYIPRTNKILWDESMTRGKLEEKEGSMFKVIFAHESLTIAFWLTILGFLLFMIFRAKREQRAIPIIEPPINSSVEFMNTISNLFYKQKDYKANVDKRHAYLLNYIRKHYYLPTEVINKQFITSLSAKSTVEEDKLSRLFYYYTQIKDVDVITSEVFLQYNDLLEDIYRTVLNK